jgi:GNAT superfamily N-acetyltransferase
MVPGRFRGLGLGSVLVRRVLLAADALRKPVLTTARPIGGNSPEALARLVRYYGRFGFHPVQHGLTAVHMRRLPGGRAADPTDEAPVKR